jgi:exonuclease III
MLFPVLLLAQDYPILGSSQSLDVMTWNVEHYPKHNQTNSYLIDIINQIDIDIIAFQEIESQNAFNSLINQLNGNWVGYISNPNSGYGELSYAINLDEVVINNIYNILSGDAYYFAYREPYVVEFTHQGIDYVIINNHFKCCGDDILDEDNSSDEEYRRLMASQLLQEYVNNNFNNNRVIILGDLNDSIIDDESNNVFLNFLNSNNFQFADYSIAYGSSSNWSYPTWPSHLDHVIITDELFEDFNESNILTFKIDEYLSGGWNSYDNYISDHRPVFMRINFNLGDVNGDGSLDILDVITIVNLILISGYDELGDINYDGTLNVIDVVMVVNSILD